MEAANAQPDFHGLGVLHDPRQPAGIRQRIVGGGARDTLSLHAFFFFMGQTIGPIAYGFGIQHAGKVPTLFTAAAIMIALGFACAKLLRHTRPADAAMTEPAPLK